MKEDDLVYRVGKNDNRFVVGSDPTEKKISHTDLETSKKNVKDKIHIEGRIRGLFTVNWLTRRNDIRRPIQNSVNR